MAYYARNFSTEASNVLPSGKAASALAVGDLVYLTSSGTWALAASAAPKGTRTDAIGIMVQNALIYETVSPVRRATINGWTGLTIGAKQYLSATGTTGNTITATKPTNTIVQCIGVARSATDIEIDVAPAVEFVFQIGTIYGATAHSLATTNTPLMVNGVLSAAAASDAYAPIYGNVNVTATQTNNVSVFTGWFEHYITGGTIVLGGNHAAVWGVLEITGNSVTTKGSLSTDVSCFRASITNSATALVNGDVMAGFLADSNITSSGVTNNGVIAAFAAVVSQSHATKRAWDCAMYIDQCDNVFSFEGAASAYKSGVKIASITGIPNASSAVFRMRDRLNGVYYYVPMYTASEITGE